MGHYDRQEVLVLEGHPLDRAFPFQFMVRRFLFDLTVHKRGRSDQTNKPVPPFDDAEVRAQHDIIRLRDPFHRHRYIHNVAALMERQSLLESQAGSGILKSQRDMSDRVGSIQSCEI